FTKILLFREHFSPKCAIHCICIENSTDSGENYLSKHASPTNLRNDGIPHGYPKKPPTVFGGILSGLRLFLTLHDGADRSEEHTSELQSRFDLVCRLLLD